MFPGKTDATLVLDNFFGKFESEFNLSFDFKREADMTSKYVRRKINNGGVEIMVKKYFGDIHIKKK